ncbi:unnamed protein product [Oikopleura dioica]|uniref:Uncharacterized protein n=1 Tax=Oikopleura dioica TaxID=34765 RepID=E4X500_OIKDI|nr:unnamed protein product [Oikopleura dioica]
MRLYLTDADENFNLLPIVTVRICAAKRENVARIDCFTKIENKECQSSTISSRIPRLHWNRCCPYHKRSSRLQWIKHSRRTCRGPWCRFRNIFLSRCVWRTS